MALSCLMLNCVVIVRLEITLSRAVIFKVGLCSVARFDCVVIFSVLKTGDFSTSTTIS